MADPALTPAIVQNVDTPHTGIFNLHRNNVKILDLASTMQLHFPTLVVNTTEMTFEDARNYRVTSEKARSILGFEPRYTIDDGIEEVRALIESARLKDVNGGRYTNQGFISANSHHLHYAAPSE